MRKFDEDSLRLKAAVEFGGDYTYTIKNGGLGKTLVIHADTRELARIIRQKAPSSWEDLYVLVTYSESEDEALEKAWIPES